MATLDIIYTKNCNDSDRNDNKNSMKNISISLTTVTVLCNDIRVSLRVDQSSFNTTETSARVA
jgi:hypothetical protein